MAAQLRVFVPPHPLVHHWLGILRDRNTPTALFRTAMTEIGRWLTYEAARDWLPILETQLDTPLGTSPARFIDPEVPIAIVPILRAGLALLEGTQAVVPLASVYHLGFVRDEATLEAHCYLNKLPERFTAETRVLISEPMLATGGTMMAVMAELVRRGVDQDQVRIISVVTAPPALQKLAEAYPSLNIYAAAIDAGLNDQGFIVPGLGDAGDRTFGT
ncbi:MAG: uracil phosphoribosyltransferase [Leptolyngbya sp. RL_3_1]|nr:uracil phosphoribosyltransferase [Leptolyngbya sp. RL_3_1]